MAKPAVHPYTDQQAIADGLLRPDEVGDISLAEEAAGATSKATAASTASAAPREISLDEFMSGGKPPVAATKPVTASPAAEISLDEFMGTAPEEPQKSTALPVGKPPREIQPGEPGYKAGSNRYLYSGDRTQKEALGLAVEGGKLLTGAVTDMTTTWLAKIPAGWRALGEMAYNAAGGDIPVHEVVQGIEDMQQQAQELPWKVFNKSEILPVLNEAMGKAMEKGQSGAADSVGALVFKLAKDKGATDAAADHERRLASSAVSFGIDAVMNLLPLAGIKGRPRRPPIEPDKPISYDYTPTEPQGPEKPQQVLYVDPAGNVMDIEAVQAREALRARNPDAFKPTPEMEPPAVRGANLAEKLDQYFNVTTEAERKTLHASRGREIREAFKSDQDYADYLRWYAENQVTMRETVPEWTAPEKGKLPGEGQPLGEVLPRAETPAIAGQLDSYQSGLQKLQQNRGFDMTAEEVAAVRNLSSEQNRPQIAQMKIEGGRAVEVLPSKAIPADIKIITALGVAGISIAAGQDLFGEDSPLKGAALVALGVGAGSKFKLHGDLKLGSAITLTKNTIPGEGPVRVTHWLDGKPIAHDHFTDIAKAEENFAAAVKADVATAKALKEVPGKTAEADNVRLFRAKDQTGSVNPKLIGKLAVAGAGAVVGAALNEDSRFAGAVLGAFGAAAAVKLSPKVLEALKEMAKPTPGRFVRGLSVFVPDMVKRGMSPDTRIRISPQLNKMDLVVERAEREINKLQRVVQGLAPKAAEQEAISHWLEGDKSIKLSPDALKAARLVETFFKEQGAAGLEAGALKDLLDNYVTHIYGRAARPLVDAMMQGYKRGAGIETPFSKQRHGLSTLAEINAFAKEKGLPPITANIVEIVGQYGRSLAVAMARSELIAGLKAEPVKGMYIKGTEVPASLIMSGTKIPEGYVRLDHPRLRDLWVHPDLKSTLNFVFDSHDLPLLLRGLEAVNMISKRMKVIGVFHDKALADASLGAETLTVKRLLQRALPTAVGAALGATVDEEHPLRGAALGAWLGYVGPGLYKKVRGTDPYIKALREGGVGDDIDRLLGGGLKIPMRGGVPGVEDVTGNFYSSLQGLQRFMDSYIPYSGKATVEPFIKLNHALDELTWNRVQAAFKISTALETEAKLITSNAKAHARDPKVPLQPREKLTAIAAEHANDVYGGLNWRRIADNMKTKLGRELALQLITPTGRRVLQLVEFAPDWTLSTARAVYKSFGQLSGGEKGTGTSGLFRPQNGTDLSRLYVLRSAMWYAVFADAINYSMSGHHFWENKDWSTIDWGDGRTMQWSKHSMEFWHWMTKFRQQFLNKLAIPVTEPIAQLTDKEYLSAYGKAPPMKSNLGHAAKQFVPIAGTQGADTGPASAVSGALGAPLYGKTDEERAATKRANRMDYSKRIDALQKRREKMMGGAR